MSASGPWPLHLPPMMTMTLEDQFPCKARSALALSEDDQLRRFVLCWERADVQWNPPKKKITATDNAAWFATWGDYRIDRDRFHMESGVRKAQVIRCFEIARNLRLIYPDGTISNEAAKVLDALAQNELLIVAERAAKVRKISQAPK